MHTAPQLHVMLIVTTCMHGVLLHDAALLLALPQVQYSTRTANAVNEGTVILT